MRLRFLGQPQSSDEQVAGAIRRALANPAHSEFYFAVAWAKKSGLSRIAQDLRDFRASDGRSVYGIVGLDEAGATWEGLQLALELCDQAWVFHDTGRPTFHPKLYVAIGDESCTAIIGSGNATMGGLFTNYEAAVEVALSLSEDEDQQFMASVMEYWTWLRGLEEACKPLDEDMLDALAEDPSVVITREGRRRRSARTDAVAAESGLGRGLFGPVRGLASAPPLPADTAAEEVDEEDDLAFRPVEPVTSADGEAEADEDEARGAGITGFWKALSAHDVHPTQSPGQIIIPKRFWDFFGDLTLQFDRTDEGGPRQSERHLVVRFTAADGSTKDCDDARAILYEPASTHKRSNKEMRFTFRNAEVRGLLKEDDILVFERGDHGVITVRHEPPGARGGGGRFGDLA